MFGPLSAYAPLTVLYVYQFLKIARCGGQGAGKERQKFVEKLLLSASGEEIRYLTRTLSQKLRVGAWTRASNLSALARVMALNVIELPNPPSDHSVDQAPSFHLSVSLLPDLEKLLLSSKGKSRNYLISKELKLSEAGVSQTPSYDKLF